MKAELIENLIRAHCSGDEDAFNKAVISLADDEEKKGNSRLSNQIRLAYSGSQTSTLISNNDRSMHRKGTAASTAAMSSPRDKDSMLELYEIVHSDISLDNVVLPATQKQLIQQILVENRKNEQLLKRKLPPANRLLLCGPPGCGKTMTAYAIAHELCLPMAYVRLDGLISSYLGQTSVNLRKVFDSVRNQRLVLFLDEFDAIAKKRDDENEMGELKRVVTALLQNFDNMPPNVFLIAATNHQHLLDPAIWRRFNYTITLGLPDEQQRTELIKRWLSDYKVEHKADIKKFVRITEGRNTSQLKELIMAAAKRQITEDKEITGDDLVALLVHQLTNNASGADTIDMLVDLNKNGVSVRSLAKAIGVSHTTLDYQIKKATKEVTADNGD
jgi:SpoVK/Ycf46/Vps4 family AAA+-type ATPase